MRNTASYSPRITRWHVDEIRWHTEIVTPATTYPLTLSEAKQHLRITHGDEDALILAYLKACAEATEKAIPGNKTFLPTTIDYVADRFPRGSRPLELPYPPLKSITSLTFYNDGGSTQTLTENTDFIKSAPQDTPGRLTPIADSWPDTHFYDSGERRPNAVVIRFVAGYDDAASVPQTIKQAIRVLLGHNYENREAVVTGTISTDIPLAFQSLAGMNDYGFI